MPFVGSIRTETKARRAYFTSDGNGREYLVMHGDATSEPDPLGAAFDLLEKLDGQRVAFNGEINDFQGEAIRIESPIKTPEDPPDLDEGTGMLAELPLPSPEGRGPV